VTLPGRLRNGCAAAIASSRAPESPTVITAAIARELVGFIWSIAKQVQSTAGQRQDEVSK
jgi:hypothetical protein